MPFGFHVLFNTEQPDTYATRISPVNWFSSDGSLLQTSWLASDPSHWTPESIIMFTETLLPAQAWWLRPAGHSTPIPGKWESSEWMTCEWVPIHTPKILPTQILPASPSHFRFSSLFVMHWIISHYPKLVLLTATLYGARVWISTRVHSWDLIPKFIC